MKRSPLKRKTPPKATKSRTRPLKASRKRVKAVSVSKLKTKLDSLFSQYVRRKNADHQGNVSCFTCGKVKHWKEQQNGHFISRQYLVTRWEEKNCRVQCVGCNMFGNGKLLDYEERLKAELGSKTVENMKLSRHQVLKLDRTYYETRINHYQNLLETL